MDLLIECINETNGVCMAYDLSGVIYPLWYGFLVLMGFVFFIITLFYVSKYFRK